jgi:hypothetical protein
MIFVLAPVCPVVFEEAQKIFTTSHTILEKENT